MRVERLRLMPTPEQMAAMYPAPHDHRIYGRGHDERVEATITLAKANIPSWERTVVADLSCGNGEIARRIWTGAPDDLHLGDYAGWVAQPGENGYTGAVEQTIFDLPHVDAYVCSETIEHLDDPGKVLALARSKADHLVLSTPIECWDDYNSEHLWAWDREGVEDLLKRTGWRPFAFDSVDSREYNEPYWYGIWVCS